MMLEDLRRRNYSETTRNSYIRIVEDFSQRFHRPPHRLDPQQIREYQAELFQEAKVGAKHRYGILIGSRHFPRQMAGRF